MEKGADRCWPREHSWALKMGGEPTTIPFVVDIDVMDTALYIVKFMLNCFNTLQTVTTASLGWCALSRKTSQEPPKQEDRRAGETQLIETLCTVNRPRCCTEHGQIKEDDLEGRGHE